MYKIISRVLMPDKLNIFPSSCILMQRNYVQIEKKVEESKVSNLKTYWFNRYVNYIKDYERVLERNFPKTMQVYRVFSIGTKDLYSDVKKYLSIIKKQSISGIDSLTREELQLSYTMPKDLKKIAPVLLILAVPFTNYFVFPIAYYFPRYLLTSHYWTLEQRLDFMLLDHRKRLKHNKPLFRCIQAELHTITNNALKLRWNGIIACLGSGTHPSTKEIIGCLELFKGPPYALKFLKRKHVKELLAIYDMSIWRPFKKRRLVERGMLIKRMDKAIIKDGGVSSMSYEAMRWALSFRGVNPANMSSESMKEWLEKWLSVSETIDEDTISLLLHGPILLAYNHPTNWILIYSKTH